MRTRGEVIALMAALAVSAAIGPHAYAALLVDLTTRGAQGTINDAQFHQVSPQATGTGYLDSFLRVQARGQESGYNTSARPVPMDDVAGNFTRDLLLSEVPVVTLGTVPYRQFLLDVNQNSGSNHELLSLNQLQIYIASSGGQTGGTSDANGRLSGVMLGTLIWDMNPGGNAANSVLLDYSLNHGSGSGDMFAYIPALLFPATGDPNVVLYSQFGNPPSGTPGIDPRYPSNAGFEEWAVVRTASPVPEPSTIIAGALLLLPFGASTLRILRKRRLA